MIPSVGMFWLFFQQTSGKLLCLFVRKRRSFLFENLKLFFTHVERVFFGTPYFAATSLFVIPFCKSFKAWPFTPIGLLFNLRFMSTLFFSGKEPRMVCLNSQGFVYVLKNWMHVLKTFECSNSSQKFWILLKKLREIRKTLSYREKFIQGTDKCVWPTETFDFSSIRVIEIFLPEKSY